MASNLTCTAQAVERAYSFIEIKSVDEEKRIIRGMATTPTVDRVGDVVEPMGGEFKLPLPLLLHHDHTAPVGEVFWARATKSGIEFEARIAKMDEAGRVKERLEEAWHSLKAKLIRAVSIGFRNIEHSVMENGGWKFLRWSWLELSLVAVPANPDATINTIRSIDRELRGASAREKRTVRLEPAGVTAPHQSQKSGTLKMATISEQISANEASRAAKAAQLANIADKAAKEGRAMNDDENAAFDDLDADIKAIDETLIRLKRVETLNVHKAVEVKEVKSGADASKSRGGYQRNTVLGPNSNIPKGIGFARMLRCTAKAGGNSELAALIAEREYPDDKRIANALRFERAAVPGAYTSDNAGWAEDIAEAQLLTTEFVELLREETIVDKLTAARRVPFNVKVPRLTTGFTANWVGEGKGIPVSAGVFDTVTMGKTKVAALTYMTKEQVRFSHIDAESTILSDAVRASAAKLNSTFVSTAAASAGVSPAGILNGLSAISANGSGSAADIRSDLQDLFAPFSAANISRRNLALIMSEDLHMALMLTHDNGFRAFPDVTAEGGTVYGMRVIPSNHVAAGDVIMISQSGMLIADQGEAEVSMSDQASIEALDGSLETDVTSGTGAPTAGVVSLWQAEAIGIRISRLINWQKGYSAAVAYIGNAGWNGVATA